MKQKLSLLSKFANMFNNVLKASIQLQAEMEVMFCRLGTVGVNESMGHKLLEYAQKKYSETPFTFNPVNILDKLYFHSSSGLIEEDAIIMVKADIIKDIQEKQIAYTFNRIQIEIFGRSGL